jgi:hypothetical protein
MDLNQGSFQPITTQYATILAVHGVFLFIAFTLAPILGSFIARYAKAWKYWFFVHIMCMITTVISTIIGVSVIASKYPFAHFDGPDIITRTHTKLGLVVMILLVMQVAIGAFAHSKFLPRRGITVFDKLHIITSRIGILAGLVNVFLGIQLMATKYGVSIVVYGLYWSVLCVALLFYVYAELYMSHRVKERTMKPELNPFRRGLDFEGGLGGRTLGRGNTTLGRGNTGMSRIKNFKWNPFGNKVSEPRRAVWKQSDKEDSFKIPDFSFE